MNELDARVLLGIAVGEAISADVAARKLAEQRRIWARRQSTSASLERRVEAERRMESLDEVDRWIRVHDWRARGRDGRTLVEERAPDTTPLPAAGWYQDPAGRFELRFWDGDTWTEHVSRAGSQFVDPPVAGVNSSVDDARSSTGVPAGWYQDPAGRFELRYWDGNTWTEHVARSGSQYKDPPVE